MQHAPLRPDLPTSGSVASAPATYDTQRGLLLLTLFSGPYARADGLNAKVRARGWRDSVQIDNDGERGGG